MSGCTPGDGDDADLIASCAAFDELERQHRRIGEPDHRTGTEEAAQQAGRLADFRAQQAPILDRIVGHTASTLPGHAARAASLHLWAWGEFERRGSAGGAWEDRLAWALIRDLLPCTIDQAAELDFEPMLIDGVMPRADFDQHAAELYAMLAAAPSLLALRPSELAEAVIALSPEAPGDVLETIASARDWAAGLANVLGCVESRCLTALARSC